MNRRTFLTNVATASVVASTTRVAAAEKATQHNAKAQKSMTEKASKPFPKGFLWGAATSAHQVEGNNVNSDIWALEHAKLTIYAEPSGDACNSFDLWSHDLDLVKAMGLNTYRFSIEWARIEPEPGQFSSAILDHYQAMIDGCHQRGLTPVVTFCHFSTPRWFAARGGWANPEAPDLFARYCDVAARRLASSIGYAITLNEPNIIVIVTRLLPPAAIKAIPLMNAAAGKACGSDNFRSGLIPQPEEVGAMQQGMLAAHKAARLAIKAARSDLPVGVALSMSDDQAATPNSVRDKMRAAFYGPWLELAKNDDFLGVQNYTRLIWGDEGKLSPPKEALINQLGIEVYAPSLAGAVRYAHEATGVPILVTEHGVCTANDPDRASLIRESLPELQKVIADGIPVKGYIHWALIDNFEWLFGYSQQYGLCSVDRKTFVRTPKPSAQVLGSIAARNGF